MLALGIGFVAGLRSLTAPAVVAWAAHVGWINLHGSPLSFMGSIWAVGIFTVLALVEFVADQLPSTPSRTAPVGLSARIVTGAIERRMSGDCWRLQRLGWELWPASSVELPEHSAAIRHASGWFERCECPTSRSLYQKIWLQSDSDYFWFRDSEAYA